MDSNARWGPARVFRRIVGGSRRGSDRSIYRSRGVAGGYSRQNLGRIGGSRTIEVDCGGRRTERHV